MSKFSIEDCAIETRTINLGKLTGEVIMNKFIVIETGYKALIIPHSEAALNILMQAEMVSVESSYDKPEPLILKSGKRPSIRIVSPQAVKEAEPSTEEKVEKLEEERRALAEKLAKLDNEISTERSK